MSTAGWSGVEDMRGPVLLVEDNARFLASIAIMLKPHFDVVTATSVAAGKEQVEKLGIRAIVVDLEFEGQEEDGLDLIDWISEHHPRIPVVVLSGDKDTDRVVGATRRPIVDFITKPKAAGNIDVLMSAIRRAINQAAQGSTRKTERNDGAPQFETRAASMRKLLQDVERVILHGGDVPILINGESGTGKEVLARYIAGRLGKLMVAANMASIPREVAESTLFGHLRGSFTGAHSNRVGLIEQAHSGFFFLDEIGEASLDIQAKLLRTIQEREVLPVGEARPRKIAVRFIAATNRDLYTMVADGRFRLDLLQRINTIIFRIPPLRERPEDVEYYVSKFLMEKWNDGRFSIAASGLSALLAYPWPGNVRELQNVIHRIAILSPKREVDGAIVEAAIHYGREPKDDVDGANSSVVSEVDSMRKKLFAALEFANGNRTKAAEALNIHPATLFRWIERCGMKEMAAVKKGRPPKYQMATSGEA